MRVVGHVFDHMLYHMLDDMIIGFIIMALYHLTLF